MELEFKLTVTVERTSGKFASREEIAQRIMEAIDDANPGDIDGVGADEESEYYVEDWTVEEIERRKVSAR